MSLFRHVTRVWCELCPKRTLLIRTRQGVCQECLDKAIEQMEHDYERRSIRFASDAQLERF